MYLPCVGMPYDSDLLQAPFGRQKELRQQQKFQPLWLLIPVVEER